MLTLPYLIFASLDHIINLFIALYVQYVELIVGIIGNVSMFVLMLITWLLVASWWMQWMTYCYISHEWRNKWKPNKAVFDTNKCQVPVGAPQTPPPPQKKNQTLNSQELHVGLIP